MALFKRLAEVIKEELFDSKPKVAPEKTKMAVVPAKPENYALIEETEQKREKRKREPVEIKIPKRIKTPYSIAKAYMTEENYDEAFGEYKKVLKYALEEFCVLTGVSPKGSKREIMTHVCDQLNIPWGQIEKFRELGRAIDCWREYGKMNNKERCLYIRGRMEEFLKLLERALENKENDGTSVVKEKAARRAAANKAARDKEAKKQRNLLSFKARETVTKGEPFDIDKEYPKVKSYLDDARDDYEKQKFYKALHDIRMSLEVMVKALCRKLSVEYRDKEELVSMINKLDETGKFSAGQKKVLSDAKWFGNMGSHDNDEKEVTESDAAKGFAEIKKVKAMFITFMTDERSIRNVPVFGTNEYYSPQRKYYGRWTHCFDYASLMMIDDYVMLKEKAEKGDIQAMLDIASGFLESSICWTEDSLIYLKKYRDPLYHPDPCDARYYCWILWACYTANKDWKAGKPLPLRYLANALLEGIKFINMHKKYKANLTSRQIVNCHNDQYAETGKLFGLHTEYASCQDDFIKMLTAMMKEYDGETLFAVVHKEKTIQDVERWSISKRR